MRFSHLHQRHERFLCKHLNAKLLRFGQAQQAKAAKETTTAKTPEVVVKSVSKFGLQCGAFKNRAQAENMQARLVMSGYNARINASADWNRVVVGPIGDRAAAASAQANAKAVADCVVVGM